MGGMLRLLVAVLAALHPASPISISHWDLEGGNKTCDGKASCETVKKNRMMDVIDWSERTCMCDELCREYGDCCSDSDHFDVGEQRRGLISFECVVLTEYNGIYMKTMCPPSWEDARVRQHCEDAGEDQRDPLTSIPVTSNETGITYRNAFCAACHSETAIELWQPRVECATIPTRPGLSHRQVISLLEFDEKTKFWGVRYAGKLHLCSVDPVKPESITHMLRPCMPDLIKTCAVNWTNSEVRSRCEAYTSIVFNGQNPYRNPHCAICNNVPLQNLLCHRYDSKTFLNRNFSPSAFAVLFDVGKIQPCPNGQLYDPFFDKCRHVLREVHRYYDYNYPTNNSIVPSVEETNHLEFYANGSSTDYTEPCPKFLLDKEDYILTNNTVYVPKYKKTFEEGEFVLRDDNTLEVCVGTLGVKLIDKFGIYMGYVTYAGLGVSIIFLLLHLVAFMMVPELRNLSGKNLASLCVALLCGYISFMAAQLLEQPSTACFVDAVVTYYCFLAAFTWMMTMSFDVWRTLRLATSELRVSAGKQWRKFTIYSLWSWLAPAVIVASAVFVDTSPDDAVSPDWRPDFGVKSCWFGSTKSLWAFFAAPLAFIMIMDILFFGLSAKMIYSSTSTTRFTASAGTQRDFRLYCRLAVVMGLTWAVGLVAGALDVTPLWYLFIGLNTLQGLFIFLAFTCTDKVIRALAHRRQDSKPLRPPSFSWSTTDSTRKSHMGSEPPTSDTLY